MKRKVKIQSSTYFCAVLAIVTLIMYFLGWDEDPKLKTYFSLGLFLSSISNVLLMQYKKRNREPSLKTP